MDRPADNQKNIVRPEGVFDAATPPVPAAGPDELEKLDRRRGDDEYGHSPA